MHGFTVPFHLFISTVVDLLLFDEKNFSIDEYIKWMKRYNFIISDSKRRIHVQLLHNEFKRNATCVLFWFIGISHIITWNFNRNWTAESVDFYCIIYSIFHSKTKYSFIRLFGNSLWLSSSIHKCRTNCNWGD